MKRTINYIIFFVLVSNLSIAQNNKIENITCQQAFDLMQKFQSDTNFIILDLRSQNMFDVEHIENAIYHDVFSEDFDNWVSRLNKNKVYLLYCTRGHRSGIARDKLSRFLPARLMPVGWVFAPAPKTGK